MIPHDPCFLLFNDLQGTRYMFMPSGRLNCGGGDITHVDLMENIPRRCPHHRWDAYYPDLPCSLKQHSHLYFFSSFFLQTGLSGFWWSLFLPLQVHLRRRLWNLQNKKMTFCKRQLVLGRFSATLALHITYTCSTACMSRICLHLGSVKISSVVQQTVCEETPVFIPQKCFQPRAYSTFPFKAGWSFWCDKWEDEICTVCDSRNCLVSFKLWDILNFHAMVLESTRLHHELFF